MTIEWPSAGKASVRSSRAALFSASQTPLSGSSTGGNAWTFQFDAPTTKIKFECTEPARFTIVFRGRTWPQRCTYGDPVLRLKLALDSPTVPEIFLSGLGPSRFNASGTHADLSVDRGALFVGADKHEIQGSSRPVIIDAEAPHKIRATLDNRESGDVFDVSFKTASASEARLSGDSRLHSALSQYMDFWLLVVGAVGGVLLAVFLERIPKGE